MTSRKQLAAELAQELGAEVQYLGVPSYAYRVGGYTVNKDGTIDGDLEAIRDFLIRHGIIQEEPVPETQEHEPDAEHVAAFESNVDTIELSVPCNDLTPQQRINLIRILYDSARTGVPVLLPGAWAPCWYRCCTSWGFLSGLYPA